MVDTDGCAQNLKAFDDEEQRIILNHAGGTHYTRDAQSHFDNETSDVCPFCRGERDSRSHRIMKCPVLVEAILRQKHGGSCVLTKRLSLWNHSLFRRRPNV